MKKRAIDIAVIANLRLGSPDCRAEEFLTYISSIKPAILILTGELITTSFTNNPGFPQTHLRIILKLFELSILSTEIIFIGNKNDKQVTKIAQSVGSNFKICKGLDLKIGKVNVKFITEREFLAFGSDSNKMKVMIDKAVKKGYSHLVFNAKRKSSKQWLETQNGELCVLHSGDWSQSLSTLEFAFRRWKIYNYNDDKLVAFYADQEIKEMDYSDLYALLPKQELQPLGKNLNLKSGE